jgi:hypothetical protein
MVGTAILIGAVMMGAELTEEFIERFAPQRLQYLSSTEISLPQDGQYIAPPSVGFLAEFQ